jgi:hypothetical protein
METHNRHDCTKINIAASAEPDWRRLAQHVTSEKDPKRLVDLLDKLIHALDELDERRRALALKHGESCADSENGSTDGNR